MCHVFALCIQLPFHFPLTRKTAGSKEPAVTDLSCNLPDSICNTYPVNWKVPARKHLPDSAASDAPETHSPSSSQDQLSFPV